MDAKTDDLAPADTVTQKADADLLAAVPAPAAAQPAAQPVAVALIATAAPATAPVASADADSDETALPAIDAAAAKAIPADAADAADVQPPVLAKAATAEKSETRSQAKAEPAANADQTAAVDATDAQKQTVDAPQGKNEPQRRDAKPVTAEPQTDATSPRQAKADDIQPAAKAQPAVAMNDGTPTLTLAPLHGHANAPASVTAPNAAQIATAVPLAGIAVEIATQVKDGVRHFEIRLDPPELGRIDVRLQVDKDGQVTSHLRVDRVETLDMLRRDSANLERALQDAGLKTSDNALNFSLRDQSLQQQANDRAQNSTQYIAADDTMPDVGDAQASAWATRLGGVDIRV